MILPHQGPVVSFSAYYMRYNFNQPLATQLSQISFDLIAGAKCKKSPHVYSGIASEYLTVATPGFVVITALSVRTRSVIDI